MSCSHCDSIDRPLGYIAACPACKEKWVYISKEDISFGSIINEADTVTLQHPLHGHVYRFPVVEYNSEVVFHGTFIGCVDSIFENGLLPATSTGFKPHGFFTEGDLIFLSEEWGVASKHSDGTVLEFQVSGYIAKTTVGSVGVSLLKIREQLSSEFIGLNFIELGTGFIPVQDYLLFPSDCENNQRYKYSVYNSILDRLKRLFRYINK